MSEAEDDGTAVRLGAVGFVLLPLALSLAAAASALRTLAGAGQHQAVKVFMATPTAMAIRATPRAPCQVGSVPSATSMRRKGDHLKALAVLFCAAEIADPHGMLSRIATKAEDSAGRATNLTKKAPGTTQIAASTSMQVDGIKPDVTGEFHLLR